jgi:hypothetical protein
MGHRKYSQRASDSRRSDQCSIHVGLLDSPPLVASIDE